MRFFLTLFILFIGIVPSISGTMKVYIYYPSATVRPQVIQKKLMEHATTEEIMVFGRYKDFKALVQQDPPDIIFTIPELLSQFPAYKQYHCGFRNGSCTEEYVIISVGKKIPSDSMSSAIVGTVDFLGKKGMGRLISSLFRKPPKIKRVIKIEDLIPLLTFNMARAILIPRRHVSYFKETSKMEFIENTHSRIQIGIIACASRNKSFTDEERKLFHKVSRQLTVLLDIEGWR